MPSYSLIRPLGRVFLVLCLFISIGLAQAQESPAPEGAIVLFDGSDFSHWTDCDGGEVKWKIVDGVMEVVPDTSYKCERIQGIKTKQTFRDFHLHVEFRLPDTKNTNSGVYLLKRYEIQIYHSHQEPFSPGMGGSLYRQKMPDVNVGRPTGEWETYDIIFRSPRFEILDDFFRKIEDARLTVIHNGVVTHNNVIVQAPTGVGFPETPEPGPIMLQDHGAQVQFRNIWIHPTESNR
jgi:hypothetical protein